MKNKLILIITLLFFLGCTNKKGDIEGKIINSIKSCKTDTCAINLNKITHFSWDKVYFFQMFVSNDYIEKSIGTKYSNYREFTHPIIFVKNGSVVYSENNEASVESLIEGQIVIRDVSDTLSVRAFTPKEATFNAVIKGHDDVTYYELIPIE